MIGEGITDSSEFALDMLGDPAYDSAIDWQMGRWRPLDGGRQFER